MWWQSADRTPDASRNRRGPWAAVLALMCAIFVSIPVPVSASDANPATPAILDVVVESDRVTLRAERVPLATVLHALAREAGVTLVLRGEPTSPFSTWTVTDVSLLDAIRHMAGDNDFVLYQAGATEHGQHVLRVFGKRDGDNAIRTREDTLRDLSHPNAHIRATAVREIAGLDGELAFDRLRTVLASDEAAAVRSEALAAISTLDGAPALDAMADTLGDDDVDVRAQLLHALGDRPEESATMALGQAYFTEDDPAMRIMAVQSLAAQRTPAARAILTTALKDEDLAVQATATRLLNTWR